MPHIELDRLEGDVRDARRRLKSDLEVLRAPETFSSFKEDVIGEARQSRDDIVANVKEAAANRAERLVADIKERAAANPWRGLTLEWQVSSPPPIFNFDAVPTVVGGPYEYGVPGAVHGIFKSPAEATPSGTIATAPSKE